MSARGVTSISSTGVGPQSSQGFVQQNRLAAGLLGKRDVKFGSKRRRNLERFVRLARKHGHVGAFSKGRARFSSSLNFTRRSGRDRDYAFASQIGSVGQGGENVLGAQAWVLRKDLVRCSAIGQVVQDDADRDARSSETIRF